MTEPNNRSVQLSTDREQILKEVAELIKDGIREKMSPEEIADNVTLSIDLMRRGVGAELP